VGVRCQDVRGEQAVPLDGGEKLIAMAGVPEPLAVSTAIEAVTITALATNTGRVWVGGPEVDAAEQEGTPLSAGDRASFTRRYDDVDDLAQVFLDVEVNGEGVTYSYGHRPEGR
jgi:hypothetical protein